MFNSVQARFEPRGLTPGRTRRQTGGSAGVELVLAKLLNDNPWPSIVQLGVGTALWVQAFQPVAGASGRVLRPWQPRYNEAVWGDSTPCNVRGNYERTGGLPGAPATVCISACWQDFLVVAVAPQMARQAQQPNRPQQGATPAGLYRMKKAVLMDDHGFAHPMPAWTLLIPTDWQVQGGAQWGEYSGCTTSPRHNHIQSGQRRRQVRARTVSPYSWQWSDDPATQHNMQIGNQQKRRCAGKPCDVMPPMSAADYVRRFAVPKLRPGKQIVSIDQFPEAMQDVQRQARETTASWARTSTPMQVRADVAGARLQYTLNGQPWKNGSPRS